MRHKDELAADGRRWTRIMNREAARDAKRDFFVGFVLILEERFRIKTHQALTGRPHRNAWGMI